MKRNYCLKRNLEGIKSKIVIHSSLGTFYKDGSLKSGGYREENLKKLKKLGSDKNKVNVQLIFKNGVRKGNVNRKKGYKHKYNHVWFPKRMKRKDILKAGQYVAKGKILKDGEKKYKTYKNIVVGIIRRKGKIVTIFPGFYQSSRRNNRRWIKNFSMKQQKEL